MISHDSSEIIIYTSFSVNALMAGSCVVTIEVKRDKRPNPLLFLD